jgi:hypothetical protein
MSGCWQHQTSSGACCEDGAAEIACQHSAGMLSPPSASSSAVCSLLQQSAGVCAAVRCSWAHARFRLGSHCVSRQLPLYIYAGVFAFFLCQQRACVAIGWHSWVQQTLVTAAVCLRDRRWRSHAPSWSMGCLTGSCLLGLLAGCSGQSFSSSAPGSNAGVVLAASHVPAAFSRCVRGLSVRVRPG